MTESERATLETWLLRAQASLAANQPQVARIQLEKVLQILHSMGEKE